MAEEGAKILFGTETIFHGHCRKGKLWPALQQIRRRAAFKAFAQADLLDSQGGDLRQWANQIAIGQSLAGSGQRVLLVSSFSADLAQHAPSVTVVMV